MKKSIICLLVSILSLSLYAQDDMTSQKSNIQTYTPSKLLSQGQWDIKFFNNLYTQTKSANSQGNKVELPRETFFTSSFDIFTGVSKNNRINVGLLFEIRSNVVKGRNALDVFQFDDTNARSGLTSFAPVVKFNPFQSISNFTIQSAFHIPVIKEESLDGVFLDQKAYSFQNRFFYDYTLPDGKWQLFTELNTEYNFGGPDDNNFAKNTLLLAPSAFMSYFPSSNSTLLAFVQHSQRFGEFKQDYTALGAGAKYQLSDIFNLEVLYSKFVRGKDNGLGQSFNIGLRALF